MRTEQEVLDVIEVKQKIIRGIPNTKKNSSLIYNLEEHISILEWFLGHTNDKNTEANKS